MPTDARDADCAHTSQRLEDAFWSHTPPNDTDADHAASCSRCGEWVEALRVLADSLATHRPPELDADRARSIRQLAARELTASTLALPTVTAKELPSGYLRELARILGWALMPLPLVLFTYLQLFQFGGALLERILPDWVVIAVGVVAASGAASWMAVVYGSIPLLAYRRLSRREGSFQSPAHGNL